MTRIFVSNSPEKLTVQELGDHATSLIGYINGYKIVGLLMLVSGVALAIYSNTIDYYSFLAGLGGGFFMAQSRSAVLAERISRLEKSNRQV